MIDMSVTITFDNFIPEVPTPDLFKLPTLCEVDPREPDVPIHSNPLRGLTDFEKAIYSINNILIGNVH